MYVGIYAEREHKQSLLGIICSWVLSFLYMMDDKTRAGPPYNPKIWKDEKAVKFMYRGKDLEYKGTCVSKEEANKTQELHRNCFREDDIVLQV